VDGFPRCRMTKSNVQKVPCECGNKVRVRIHTIVDLTSGWHWVRQMEKGFFHNAPCNGCGKRIQVEKWFMCEDAARRIIIHVFPRAYRPFAAKLEAQVHAIHRLCDMSLQMQTCIVYGIEDLLRVVHGQAPVERTNTHRLPNLPPIHD
jgi:hypothetical protein